MRKIVLMVCIVAAFCGTAIGDEGHHEDLTQAQLGLVHFPVSCTPEAQKTFEKGVALLHSFWYEEAEKTFLEVEKQDPQCAMAHWGVAMSLWHQLWDEPNAATINRGALEVKKAEKTRSKAETARERDYIAALGKFYSTRGNLDHKARARAYSDAMDKIYERYPEDHEAAAFYALSLLASEPDNDTTFANRKKAGAILEKLFALEPDHPGIAHYLIHTYDKPQLARTWVAGSAALRADRSVRAPCSAYAFAHFCARRRLARFHQVKFGIDRGDAACGLDAHGRRGPPVPRHGLSDLCLSAERPGR